MPAPDAPYYFLLVQATNAVRRASDRAALTAGGITTAQAGALFAIAKAGRPSQRHIGATLGLGEAAVTGLVNRLETAGLVRREPDPDDRRARRLTLTDEGRHALDVIEPARLALNHRIAELLGDDAERVAAALQRLTRIDHDHDHDGDGEGGDGG